MTKNRLTQSEKVFMFIRTADGQTVTTNQIRRFCQENFIADGLKRCREMVAKGILQRRDMSTYEMEQRHLSTRVKIFYLKSEETLV